MNYKEKFAEFLKDNGKYKTHFKSKEKWIEMLDIANSYFSFDIFELTGIGANLFKKINLEYEESVKTNDHWIAYNKSKGNEAPSAVLRANHLGVFLNSLDIKIEIPDSLQESEYFHSALTSSEFYFKNGQEYLIEFLRIEIDSSKLESINELYLGYSDDKKSAKYLRFVESIQDELIQKCAYLIGKIIAYCDKNASNKNELNDENDKRVVAKSQIRQNQWIADLIKYKLGEVEDKGTFYAFQYLKYPLSYSTVLKKEHRELIYKYLFRKENEFTDEKFQIELSDYVDSFNLSILNPINKTLVASIILYSDEFRIQWDKNYERNYWAGGFAWGNDSQLERFKSESIWQLGYSSDSENKIAKRMNNLFSQIKVGDWFIIKGFGGKSDLVCHYYGEVLELLDNSTLKLKQIENIEMYSGKAPNGAGAGNWFDSLLKISRPDIISKLFGNVELNMQSTTSIIDLDIEKNNYKNENPLNQILYGPPGTGKTYNTIAHAVAICRNINFEIIEAEYQNDPTSIKDEFKELKDSGQIVFSTFHQSMSYEDFIEGIKPDSTNGEISYDVEDGFFKSLSQKAQKNLLNSILPEKSIKREFEEVWSEFIKPLSEGEEINIPMSKSSYTIEFVSEKTIPFKKQSGLSNHSLSIKTLKLMYEAGENKIINGGLQPYYNPLLEKLLVFGKSEIPLKIENAKPHVLIIDEINRGNVSAIFGELITLLEDDKRLGAVNELQVKLPYSKEEFGVPPNLHIIGTMNTADRSVEALDTALRRRFSFTEMMPDSKLLHKNKGFVNVDGVELDKLLEAINWRLEKLKDRDLQIGHAFFMSVNSIKKLRTVFKDKVIPQLQEYFYGDWEKIQFILGERFINSKEANKPEYPWPGKNPDLDRDLKCYTVNKIDWSAEDFRSIYSKHSDKESDVAAESTD